MAFSTKPTFYIGDEPNDESIVRFTSSTTASSTASPSASPPASPVTTIVSSKPTSPSGCDAVEHSNIILRWALDRLF